MDHPPDAAERVDDGRPRRGVRALRARPPAARGAARHAPAAAPAAARGGGPGVQHRGRRLAGRAPPGPARRRPAHVRGEPGPRGRPVGRRQGARAAALGAPLHAVPRRRRPALGPRVQPARHLRPRRARAHRPPARAGQRRHRPALGLREPAAPGARRAAPRRRGAVADRGHEHGRARPAGPRGGGDVGPRVRGRDRPRGRRGVPRRRRHLRPLPGGGAGPGAGPRRAARGEHVDDHQLQIAQVAAGRGLAVVREVDDLRAEDLVTAAGLRVVPA